MFPIHPSHWMEGERCRPPIIHKSEIKKQHRSILCQTSLPPVIQNKQLVSEELNGILNHNCAKTDDETEIFSYTIITEKIEHTPYSNRPKFLESNDEQNAYIMTPSDILRSMQTPTDSDMETGTNVTFKNIAMNAHSTDKPDLIDFRIISDIGMNSCMEFFYESEDMVPQNSIHTRLNSSTPNGQSRVISSSDELESATTQNAKPLFEMLPPEVYSCWHTMAGKSKTHRDETFHTCSQVLNKNLRSNRNCLEFLPEVDTNSYTQTCDEEMKSKDSSSLSFTDLPKQNNAVSILKVQTCSEETLKNKLLSSECYPIFDSDGISPELSETPVKNSCTQSGFPLSKELSLMFTLMKEKLTDYQCHCPKTHEKSYSRDVPESSISEYTQQSNHSQNLDENALSSPEDKPSWNNVTPNPYKYQESCILIDEGSKSVGLQDSNDSYSSMINDPVFSVEDDQASVIELPPPSSTENSIDSSIIQTRNSQEESVIFYPTERPIPGTLSNQNELQNQTLTQILISKQSHSCKSKNIDIPLVLSEQHIYAVPKKLVACHVRNVQTDTNPIVWKACQDQMGLQEQRDTCFCLIRNAVILKDCYQLVDSTCTDGTQFPDVSTDTRNTHSCLDLNKGNIYECYLPKNYISDVYTSMSNGSIDLENIHDLTENDDCDVITVIGKCEERQIMASRSCPDTTRFLVVPIERNVALSLSQERETTETLTGSNQFVKQQITNSDPHLNIRSLHNSEANEPIASSLSHATDRLPIDTSSSIIKVDSAYFTNHTTFFVFISTLYNKAIFNCIDTQLNGAVRSETVQVDNKLNEDLNNTKDKKITMPENNNSNQNEFKTNNTSFSSLTSKFLQRYINLTHFDAENSKKSSVLNMNCFPTPFFLNPASNSSSVIENPSDLQYKICRTQKEKKYPNLNCVPETDNAIVTLAFQPYYGFTQEIKQKYEIRETIRKSIQQTHKSLYTNKERNVSYTVATLYEICPCCKASGAYKKVTPTGPCETAPDKIANKLSSQAGPSNLPNAKTNANANTMTNTNIDTGNVRKALNITIPTETQSGQGPYNGNLPAFAGKSKNITEDSSPRQNYLKDTDDSCCVYDIKLEHTASYPITLALYSGQVNTEARNEINLSNKFGANYSASSKVLKKQSSEFNKCSCTKCLRKCVTVSPLCQKDDLDTTSKCNCILTCGKHKDLKIVDTIFPLDGNIPSCASGRSKGVGACPVPISNEARPGPSCTDEAVDILSGVNSSTQERRPRITDPKKLKNNTEFNYRVNIVCGSPWSGGQKDFIINYINQTFPRKQDNYIKNILNTNIYKEENSYNLFEGIHFNRKPISTAQQYKLHERSSFRGNQASFSTESLKIRRRKLIENNPSNFSSTFSSTSLNQSESDWSILFLHEIPSKAKSCTTISQLFDLYSTVSNSESFSIDESFDSEIFSTPYYSSSTHTQFVTIQYVLCQSDIQIAIERASQAYLTNSMRCSVVRPELVNAILVPRPNRPPVPESNSKAAPIGYNNLSCPNPAYLSPPRNPVISHQTAFNVAANTNCESSNNATRMQLSEKCVKCGTVVPNCFGVTTPSFILKSDAISLYCSNCGLVFDTVCPNCPNTNKLKSKESPIKLKDDSPLPDSKKTKNNNSFETVIKEITKVRRYRKSDGVIIDEKKIVTIKTEKKYPYGNPLANESDVGTCLSYSRDFDISSLRDYCKKLNNEKQVKHQKTEFTSDKPSYTITCAGSKYSRSGSKSSIIEKTSNIKKPKLQITVSKVASNKTDGVAKEPVILGKYNFLLDNNPSEIANVNSTSLNKNNLGKSVSNDENCKCEKPLLMICYNKPDRGGDISITEQTSCCIGDSKNYKSEANLRFLECNRSNDQIWSDSDTKISHGDTIKLNEFSCPNESIFIKEGYSGLNVKGPLKSKVVIGKDENRNYSDKPSTPEQESLVSKEKSPSSNYGEMSRLLTKDEETNRTKLIKTNKSKESVHLTVKPVSMIKNKLHFNPNEEGVNKPLCVDKYCACPTPDKVESINKSSKDDHKDQPPCISRVGDYVFIESKDGEDTCSCRSSEENTATGSIEKDQIMSSKMNSQTSTSDLNDKRLNIMAMTPGAMICEVTPRDDRKDCSNPIKFLKKQDQCIGCNKKNEGIVLQRNFINVLKKMLQFSKPLTSQKIINRNICKTCSSPISSTSDLLYKTCTKCRFSENGSKYQNKSCEVGPDKSTSCKSIEIDNTSGFDTSKQKSKRPVQKVDKEVFTDLDNSSESSKECKESCKFDEKGCIRGSKNFNLNKCRKKGHMTLANGFDDDRERQRNRYKRKGKIQYILDKESPRREQTDRCCGSDSSLSKSHSDEDYFY